MDNSYPYSTPTQKTTARVQSERPLRMFTPDPRNRHNESMHIAHVL